jgi:hypothetical protein
MDFITGLPIVDGLDCVKTFVDTVTEQTHFIPCSIHNGPPQLARLDMDNMYRYHGLYRTIISDRDT